jgi:2-polyprenyl-3-methyl-5-hydroxy-6-metoxy-1,4-benzoquinol methylase
MSGPPNSSDSALGVNLQHLDAIRDAEIDKVISFFPAGARILEIGAGTGKQALELQRRGFAVTAIDMPDSTYAAQRVFPIRDYDGRTFPLPGSSVDAVFSSNVLEHVPDLSRMHAEIRRVLAPSGICVHVVPTHAWRFWTTVTSYLKAIAFFVSSVPQLAPQASLSSAELRRLRQAWYWSVRHTAGLCLPRRHGERGNVVSELWLFQPRWWRRNFEENGFAVVADEPMGLFYTGQELLGLRLSLAKRARLARVLGSSSHVFKLEPVLPGRAFSPSKSRGADVHRGGPRRAAATPTHPCYRPAMQGRPSRGDVACRFGSYRRGSVVIAATADRCRTRRRLEARALAATLP